MMSDFIFVGQHAGFMSVSLHDSVVVIPSSPSVELGSDTNCDDPRSEREHVTSCEGDVARENPTGPPIPRRRYKTYMKNETTTHRTFQHTTSQPQPGLRQR